MKLNQFSPQEIELFVQKQNKTKQQQQQKQKHKSLRLCYHNFLEKEADEKLKLKLF